MTRWSGVFPAVTTKLKEDGALDLPALQASVDRLIVSGVSGVIARRFSPLRRKRLPAGCPC